MNCPKCQREHSKVTNTYPGDQITRRYQCRNAQCNATWKTRERLVTESLQIAPFPLRIAPAPLYAITGINERISLSSGFSGQSPDPNPTSPENPIRAGAREAKKAPSYESEFLLIWNFTGKRGNKFKAQKSWIACGRPAFTLIQAKYTEYKASLEPWQSQLHLATWFNGWGHEQEWTPATNSAAAPKKQAVPFAVAAEEARQERILQARFESLTEDLRPRSQTPHPRDEYRAMAGGKK